MIFRNLLYTILLFQLYGLMDIAVPAIVLYPFLRDRKLGFRILFYQIAGLAYISFASYVLCYCRIYSALTAWIAFLIVPLGIRLYISRSEARAAFEKRRRQYAVSQSIHEELRLRLKRRGQSLRASIRRFVRSYIRPNLLTILSFALLVFIVSKDLGYFHLHNYSYTCSDEPTHIYWISAMLNGDPFPAGLYPHGMHFVVGELCAMFGLNVTRAWLSFGIVSVCVILFSAFLCAGELFSNRVSGLIGIFLVLCVGLFPEDVWFQRLQMVMPMEYAMYAFFAALYGLIAWIREDDMASLWMIGLGILGTMLIHIFVTIFLFFVVVAYVLIFHGVMAERKNIHKLVLCGMLSVALALLPYIVGFLCGFQLEQSFRWGMDYVSLNSSSYSSGNTAVYTPSVGLAVIEEPTTYSIKDQIIEAASPSDYFNILGNILSLYFTNTALAGYLILCCCLCYFLYGGIGFLRQRQNREAVVEPLLYLFVACSWALGFLLLYVGYVLGLFSLMVPSRSTEFISLFSIFILGAPVQLVMKFLEKRRGNVRLPDTLLTCLGLVGMLIFTICNMGISYKDLSYLFTIQNEDLRAEEYLSDHNEKDTWTFVGTTNARMAVINNGYHYEITDILLNARDAEELYIPTKDIYVSVEKYVPIMSSKASDGSDFESLCVPVSAAFANVLLSDVMQMDEDGVNSEIYLDTYSRLIVMSHLNYWIQKLQEVYPNEVSVFMEDQYCTIYHIRQDEYFLLNMVVDYSDLVERDLATE